MYLYLFWIVRLSQRKTFVLILKTKMKWLPVQPCVFQTHPLHYSLSTFPLVIQSFKSSHLNIESFSSLLLRVNFRLSAVWYVHHWGSEWSREQR